MQNNDVLRSLRYALNITEIKMIDVFKLADFDITHAELIDLLRKEDEEGYQICSDTVLSHFLDGLIVLKRGKRGDQPAPVRAESMSNNLVLKKLRIAFELKEDDLLDVLSKGNIAITKSALSALFRKPGHKHYKKCGDQILRKFLVGLTHSLRG